MADYSKIFSAIDSAVSALNELKAALEEEPRDATPAAVPAQPAAAPFFAPSAQPAPSPSGQQTSMAHEMICASCGAAMTAGSKFCTKCGAPVQTPAPPPIRRGGFCTNCGATLTPADKFCTKCGARV